MTLRRFSGDVKLRGVMTRETSPAQHKHAAQSVVPHIFWKRFEMLKFDTSIQSTSTNTSRRTGVNMKAEHKNKTTASLLSVFVGALGLHRFYIYGWKDVFGWAYLIASAIYLIIFTASRVSESLATSVAILFPIPVFVAAIETLVIGLTDDAKWDQRHNTQSLTQSRSRGPLVFLLVVTLLVLYTAFIASLSRAIDLLYTGGAFG